MESASGYKLKLATLEQAIKSFKESLELDLSGYTGVELDTIKSGQVQKFEYCAELCWKAIKQFLDDVHGIDSVSPKTAIKNFYLAKQIQETEYETLVEMVNDRNRLSHIYEAVYFEEIHSRLKEYLDVMMQVAWRLRKEE